MVTKPLALVSLSREQFYADNLLCSRHIHMETQFDGKPMAVSLKPSPSCQGCDMTVVLQIDDTDISVQVNRSLFGRVEIGGVNIGDVIDKLPEPLLVGALRHVFGRAIKDLRSLLQKEVTLKTVRFVTETITAPIALLLQVDGVTHTGYINANPQTLKWLESLPQPENVTQASSHIPCLLTLEAGRTVLGSRELEQLCVNDLILMDKNWYAEKTVFVRTSLTCGFIAQFKENSVTLVNSLELPVNNNDIDDIDDFDDDFEDDLDDDLEDDLKSEIKGKEPEQSPKETAPEKQQGQSGSLSADVNNIPVQLTFDLGQQEIPLGDMSRLAPGFTFQLNRPVASPVKILANGKPLAEGELVDINGQVGARITRML